VRTKSFRVIESMILDTPPGGDRKRKDEVRATGPPKAMFPEMAKVLSLAWVVGIVQIADVHDLENVSGHAMGPIEEACHGAVVGSAPIRRAASHCRCAEDRAWHPTARGCDESFCRHCVRRMDFI